MHRFRAAGMLMIAASLVFGARSNSEQRTRQSPRSAEAVQAPIYDAATVINEMATVVEFREVLKDDALCGVHLVVKTDSATLDVFVGPVEFVKQFEFTVIKGDRVQVAGSRVKFRGVDVVLAREVRNQQMTLYLRDRKGVPNWGH
jgi:hypothetical protein